METEPTPPRWLKPLNKVMVAGQRAGLGMGGLDVLTLPGRRSGKPRRTPLSVMTHEGERYVLGGFPNADWVRNARAADGLGTLSRGRKHERVRLMELSAEQARPFLRLFPIEVPTGVPIMKDAGLVAEGTPDEYEALAGRCAVFRIDPA
ncbi:deazaflavin-dependent nitroreductase [Amycolatopsis antarctica]|uniref:Deazaflavin-dependent nitroreductase n=1 Tax=Amycolatopsis antarctica TaxID=1854586 RepID=A0A263D7B9_9PSEU|nr:nitroreductase/quinone reductase family protein [Amycolatopsis antarctica]OZM73305.1 deazaflavin-dependent nitroreductase [Amycolatopsis antarctica]